MLKKKKKACLRLSPKRTPYSPHLIPLGVVVIIGAVVRIVTQILGRHVPLSQRRPHGVGPPVGTAEEGAPPRHGGVDGRGDCCLRLCGGGRLVRCVLGGNVEVQQRGERKAGGQGVDLFLFVWFFKLNLIDVVDAVVGGWVVRSR